MTMYQNGPMYQRPSIKKESCVSVCVFVRVFRSHKKPQRHEILVLGVFWANLKYDEARSSTFGFLRVESHMVPC